jgi:trk system potassium uptake protein TrkA
VDIIICGAGEVGSHASEVLAAAGHRVTVIDADSDRLRAISDNMDVRTLTGNCTFAHILKEANVANADLLVAATNCDEVNLLAASIGKHLGAAKTIARVHHSAFRDQRGLDYQSALGIDQLICPEYLTATAIARTLRNPAALAIEHFSRGRIDMQEFPVSHNAPALGKPLASLKLPPGVRVATVTRDEQVALPDAETSVKPGDRIVLVGDDKVFQDARKLFQKEDAGRRKVVLMGGGAMSLWLCRALRDRNWSIRLFETDRDLAKDLASKLTWVTVIQDDPTDRAVFQEEQLAQADVFVGLLDDDEANIIACVLAKTMGVTRVVAVVQRPNYLDLLYHIGIDRPFSPRIVAARAIETVLNDSPLQLLASLAEGQVDAFLVRIGANSQVDGKTLREVPLTPNWMVAAIRRNDEVWVPQAKDVLQTGDTVLVIGRHGQEDALRALLVAK